MAQEGLRRSKLPPGTVVHVRDKETPIRTTDEEQISPSFVAAGLAHLQEVMGRVARNIENRSNPVDEYNTATLSGGAGSVSLVTLQPTYDQMNEKIISILIAGPPAAQVTLILGDRNIPLVIPSTGVLDIGPVGCVLGRNDPRQLIAQTPGAYFLELMGWADRRFNI